MGGDLKTAQTIERKGTYKVSGNVLQMFFSPNQAEASYQIIWEGKEKLILSNSQEYLVFAVLGSPKDVFLSNYFLQEQIQIQNDSRAHQQEWEQRKYETEVCKTCFGTGSCKVCGGTGRYSLLGYSSVCNACSGTGKCWHCKGSRLQNR
jgi:DnaJ-class molecular chaperone